MVLRRALLLLARMIGDGDGLDRKRRRETALRRLGSLPERLRVHMTGRRLTPSPHPSRVIARPRMACYLTIRVAEEDEKQIRAADVGVAEPLQGSRGEGGTLAVQLRWPGLRPQLHCWVAGSAVRPVLPTSCVRAGSPGYLEFGEALVQIQLTAGEVGDGVAVPRPHTPHFQPATRRASNFEWSQIGEHRYPPGAAGILGAASRCTTGRR